MALKSSDVKISNNKRLPSGGHYCMQIKCEVMLLMCSTGMRELQQNIIDGKNKGSLQKDPRYASCDSKQICFIL